MASLRKRYQEHVETSPRQDGPPVTTAPTEAAKLPPAVDAKPPEPITTESPADAAGRDAIKQRLQEMQQAERITREAVSHPQPPQPREPQEPQQRMPAQVEKWLAEHPQYLDPNDHVAQAEIHLATVKCMRDGKTWDQPDFIPTIERHLGLAPRGNGQTQHGPIESKPPAPAAPRYEAPPRQQQRSATPVSAPPTREAPSMTTGRPASRRVPLTAEQVEMAKASGISVEEYERQLIRMNQMKAAGALDDRR
jgi:hypothetical protein